MDLKDIGGDFFMFLVLTCHVSVVGAHMSLTMGYHGPSANLLYPGVCERLEPLWPTSYARLRIPFSRFLPRSSAPGGLNVIRKAFLQNHFRCPPTLGARRT